VAAREAAGGGIDVSAVARVPGDSTRSLVLVTPGERTIVNLNRCREPGPPQRLASLEADAVYVRSRDLDLRSSSPTWRPLPRVAHVRRSPPLASGHVLVGSESDLPRSSSPTRGPPAGRSQGDAEAGGRHARPARGRAFGASERVAVPAPAVPVVDSTAAGDVFAAGLVHGLALGRPNRAVLETAVAWGAATVACPGVPSRETIEGCCRLTFPWTQACEARS